MHQPKHPYYHLLPQNPQNPTNKSINAIKAVLNNPIKQTLTNLITTKMQQQLMRAEITLGEDSTDCSIKLDRYIHKKQKKCDQELLNKVHSQKKMLLNKIKQLDQQQHKLKKNKLKTKSLQKIHSKPNILSKPDKELLKNLIQQKKSFDQQINQKNKSLFQYLKNKSIEQHSHYQQIYQIKQEKKRLDILSKILQLQKKSNQRKQFIVNADRNIRNMQKLGYLYRKNQTKQANNKIQQQQQYKQKLQHLKNQYKINFDTIKQHQKKFQEHLREHKVQQKQKIIQDKIKKRCKSYANYYYQILNKFRIQQQKRQLSEKSNERYQKKQRIQKYQQKIKQNHLPKISNDSIFKPQQKTVSIISLSRLEREEKGKQYLQIAKKLKDQNKQEEKQKLLIPVIVKKQFIDYTKTLKYKPPPNPQSQLLQLKKNIKIYKDINSTTRAVQLTDRIQAKSKLSFDDKIISSAKHKIDILHALE